MRIVVDVNHPAHVHFFKNFIRCMGDRGHQVLITATKKDVSFSLLNNYGFKYVDLGSYGSNSINKIINLPIINIKLYNAVKDFKPDLFLGLASIRAAQISRMMGKPSIIFDDTEHAKFEHMLYTPFASTILTPSSFKIDYGKKHIRFKGCKELAYLHPDYFKPDPSVLDEVGLAPGEPFIIIRFISWDAVHDLGQSGIKKKTEMVEKLSKYGRILISSEDKLSDDMEKYKLRVAPEKFHSLLHYATMYIGEGGTPASESAYLGTHAIHVSTTASKCGVFDDLNSYGLVWTTNNTPEALRIAEELLSEPDLRAKGKQKLERLLDDKISTTDFLTWLVEKYPGSIDILRQDPKFEDKFKRDRHENAISIPAY
jgi:uncharacterized protein